MKIENGNIKMLIDSDSTRIELFDTESRTLLARVILTPEQLSKMLARHAFVKCEIETGDLNNVGKTQENKQFEFEITYTKSQDDLCLACAEAMFEQNMFEWVPNNYYNSHNSFFTKDDKEYARVTISRWV